MQSMVQETHANICVLCNIHNSCLSNMYGI